MHEQTIISTRLTAMLIAVAALALFCVGSQAFAQAEGDAVFLHHVEHQHSQAATAGASTTPPNTNCTLILPKSPLTAQGLATPFQLTATDPGAGPCNEADDAQSAFVQAAVFDPATNTISIYNPLIIDRGSTPVIDPVVPKLPSGAIVALWFGFNGDDLTLRAANGDSLSGDDCVNGNRSGVFGQFSYCNAPAFFRAANVAIDSGKLQVPALGSAKDGQPCPSVRDFLVVDQDQSDNLPTTYLATPRGRTAQATKRNAALLRRESAIGNPSDNGLVDGPLDSTMGCTPWKAPDLADPGQSVAALPLNELQARQFQATPVALVPLGDPMTQSNGNNSLFKTNLYREGVDQPDGDSIFDADTGRYCRQMLRIAPARLLANRAALSAVASPDAGAANTLYNFLTQRFVGSYDMLDCADIIGIPDPVSVKTDANGVAMSTTLNASTLNQAIQKLAAQKAQDDRADSATRAR